MSESANHKPFFARRYFLIMLAAVFLLPFVTRGARKAIQTNKNEIKDWLPANYPESADLKWFQGHFAGEQFALVSWEGCTLGNTQKLKLLAQKLVPGGEHAIDTERTKLFKEVITGPEVLEELIGPPLRLSHDEALRRIEGSLIGPLPKDGTDADRTTCMVVTLSELGKKDNRHKRLALDTIKAAAAECAIPPLALHMGGPPVDNVAIDVEGEKTLVRLAGLAGVVGIGLCYLCLRNGRYTAMVFAVGVIGAMLSLAIVYYFGLFEMYVKGLPEPWLGTVDAILMSMPSVVYVLGLSGAIHLVNYYRDARRESGPDGAAEKALRHGWQPCVLAAVTTAVGLASLYTSDITPIKKFGTFTALGVLSTVVLLFTLLPAALYRFAPKDDGARGRGPDGEPVDKHPLFHAFMEYVAQFIIRRSGLVCAVAAVVVIFLGFGLTMIETRVQLLKLFDEDADIIHDYAWLETHLGPLVPMEVVITVDDEHRRQSDEDPEADGRRYKLNMFERMQLIARVQRRIESLKNVGRALSAATFAPTLPEEKSGLTRSLVDPRRVINLQLEKHRGEFLAGDYLRDEEVADGENAAEDPKVRELWRISARLGALDDVDYGRFVDELRHVVGPVLGEYLHRDQIVESLHAAGKKLRLANVCLLYHAEENAAAPATSNPTQLLGTLLREAGARVTYLNLARLPQDDSREEVIGQVRAALEKQDCVVVATSREHFDPAPLIEGAPLVVDAAAATETSNAESAEGLAAVYTGLVPLVYKTQRQLLVSLRESMAWASVLIAAVMALVMRNLVAGLVAMIPNLFPIVVIFGALGWLGIKVDIGIMMTASVALGVAVDDTVHFWTWFRRGLERGLDRREATLWAYHHCATAMFQTTVIGGLGLAVFAVSSFTPTQQFGYLMVTLLSAALVGDLVVLPALLCSPLGKLFCRQTQLVKSEAGEPPMPTGKVAGQGQHLGRPQLRRDSPHSSVNK